MHSVVHASFITWFAHVEGHLPVWNLNNLLMSQRKTRLVVFNSGNFESGKRWMECNLFGLQSMLPLLFIVAEESAVGFVNVSPTFLG